MHRDLTTDRALEHRQNPHEHFMFEGIEYPVSRQDLIDLASDSEYDPDTLNLVRSLPDRTFTSRDDIWRSMAEATRVFAGGTGTPRDDIGKQATGDKVDG